MLAKPKVREVAEEGREDRKHTNMEAGEERAEQSRAGQGTKGMKYKGLGNEKSLVFQQSRAGKDVTTPVQFLAQILYYFSHWKTSLKGTTPKYYSSRKVNRFLKLKANSPAHLKSEYNDLQQLKIRTGNLFLNANTSR